MARKHSDIATKQPDVTAMTSTSRPAWLRKRILVLGVIVLVIIGAGLYWIYKPSHNDNSLYQAEQQTLQTTLDLALNQNDNQTVVNLTTQLVNGKKAGHFTFNDSMLAQYYLEKASSLINLKQYAQAIPAFEAAGKLDSGSQQAALQGEVMARYDIGQRQQLVPLLEQLKSLAAKNPGQLSASPAQYQYDITALQHNQDIEL